MLCGAHAPSNHRHWLHAIHYCCFGCFQAQLVPVHCSSMATRHLSNFKTDSIGRMQRRFVWWMSQGKMSLPLFYGFTNVIGVSLGREASEARAKTKPKPLLFRKALTHTTIGVL